ncbi:MAG: bifunctional nicotinamidase/pyrazinamidase [Chitinophagales bacterium]|nr:bifunctional nicotinamidase/pyrazinamidase [Chitinophagales bacterium]
MKKALLLIDLQNDFMPGGALAVPQGNEVIAIANRLQPSFDWVIATQDWHPANHGSFAANNLPQNIGDVINLDGLPQIMWPIHCVQNTNGANFTSDLDITHIKAVFQKGTDPNIDSYSGFFDNGKRKSTGLGNFLLQQGITDVYIMGLALDYCVKFSALDAVTLGFNTYLIADACRAVNLQPTDGTKALAEMEAAGVKIVQSAELYVK